MKTTKILTTGISLALILALFTGCKKELTPLPSPEDNRQVSSMTELNIPEGFDWKMTREVTLNLGINSVESSSVMHRITLYNADPFSGGKAFFSGSAGYGLNLVAKVVLPTALKEVYVVLSSSGIVEQVVTLDVAGNIAYTFQPLGGGLKEGTGSSVVSPDCNSGCDQTLSGSGSITISNGNTYCITSSYSGSVNITKGTLQICGTFIGTISVGGTNYASNLIVTAGGTANISSLSLAKKSTMTVYPGSAATMGSMSMASDAKVYNYGVFNVSGGGLNFNNLIENEGSMTINGTLAMTTSAILHNSGTLHVVGAYNSEKEIINSGTIEVDGNLNLCTQLSNVTNTCKMIVHGNLTATNCNFTLDQGYVKVDNLLELKSTCNLVMKNGSMISTNNYKQYQNVIGQGSSNEIKIVGSGNIYNSKKVNGNIEMTTPAGTLNTGGLSNFINGATLVSPSNSIAVIPVTACNPEGNTGPGCPDNDSDGVTDCDDDYPDDPDRAYNNITTGTVVWEDLWPSQGDYDMNDLVNNYQYNLITDANNKVVDVVAKFYVRAVGASFNNGFGFQFDNVLPAQIESVTGYSLTKGYVSLNANGTESSQAKAVVVVWDDADNVIHRPGGSFFNTMPGSLVGTSDTVTLAIHFGTPLTTSLVGTPPFNPFLIKDGNREVEIHLPDYVPTSLANPSYFGTNDDDSNPLSGTYYKTSLNLPWAINIPDDFDYPFEYIDITQAYNYFASWAESGGLINLDWYFDLPGYRNNSNIY